MSRKLVLNFIVILFVLSLVSLNAGVAMARQDEGLSQSKFIALSKELSLMNQQNIFTNSGQSVNLTLENNVTGKHIFSLESVSLAKELVDFTNQVVSSKGTNVSLEGKPNLMKYFNAAVAYNKTTISNNLVPESLLSEYVCGTWWHPVPGYGQIPYYKYPASFSSQKAAEDKIISWSYHKSSIVYGGAFTRAQTYNPALCGYNTFRDNAGVYYSSGWRIWEQNYTGSITGEPNPEVFYNGNGPWSWPYPTWPAYVVWWHLWGPGK